MRTAHALGLLGIAITLTAGCAAGAETAAPATASPNAVGVPTQLDFTATTVDGREFSGATLAGRPAVLWFWTPWCPTCQAEAPAVAKVARDNPDVAFVGVSAQDQVPAMQAFIDKYALGFTNIADVDGAIWQRFGVTAQPVLAFLGRDGSIDIVRGPIPATDLAVQVANHKH